MKGKKSHLDIVSLYKTYDNKQRMFGEVIEDDRFPKGHLLCTSPIKSVDEEKKVVITESGTEYTYEKLMDIDEFLKFAKENFTPERVEIINQYVSIGY